jgi:hypothetical protein
VVSVSQGGPVRRVPLWLPGLDRKITERELTPTRLEIAQAG